jgi:hypothetical protein
MNAIEVARNHFDSWNRHDADAIGGGFVEGGPTTIPTSTSLRPEQPSGILLNLFSPPFLTCRLKSSVSGIPEAVSSRSSGCCAGPIPAN